MDILQRVNGLFRQYNVDLQATRKIKLAEIALEDGTTILTDGETFDVGAAVYVMSPEGNQIPLPDGTYTLADGTTIVVVEGVITEVGAAAAAEEPAGEMPAAMGQYMTRKQTEDLIVQTLAGVIKNQAAQFADIRKEFAAQKAITAKMAKTTPLSRNIEVPEKPVDIKGLSGLALVQALQDQLK